MAETDLTGPAPEDQVVPGEEQTICDKLKSGELGLNLDLEQEKDRITTELAAVQAARSRMLSGGVASYSVAGRSVQFTSLNDLTAAERQLRWDLANVKRRILMCCGRRDPRQWRVVFR